jgi:hypothetical protein
MCTAEVRPCSAYVHRHDRQQVLGPAKGRPGWYAISPIWQMGVGEQIGHRPSRGKLARRVSGGELWPSTPALARHQAPGTGCNKQ